MPAHLRVVPGVIELQLLAHVYLGHLVIRGTAGTGMLGPIDAVPIHALITPIPGGPLCPSCAVIGLTLKVIGAVPNVLLVSLRARDRYLAAEVCLYEGSALWIRVGGISAEVKGTASIAAAPSSYYAALKRPVSVRARRDEGLKDKILQVWEQNRKVYGPGISGGSCRIRGWAWPGARWSG